MKILQLAALVALVSTAATLTGCRQKQDETAAIRAGINEHLRTVGTLNLNAMDMNVRKITVNGNQADAEVEFVPKSGAPAGAGMQVSYSLEKRDGGWIVTKRSSLGGGIAHPEGGSAPQQQPEGAVHGMPNFQELLQPANPGASPGSKLPPGHPPVKSQTSSSSQPAQPKNP